MPNCNIIYNGKEYTDDEFLGYLADRGITHELLSREKDLLDSVKPLIPEVKGVYKSILEKNPREGLFEVAAQANSSDSERSGTVSAVGEDIVNIALELFPNAKAGGEYLHADEGDVNASPQANASPATVAKIKEFNNRIGVRTEQVNEIVVRGEKLNATGIAIAYQGLIQIVNGKVDTILPEESMHIALEITQQTNAPLFTAMMKDVNNYSETDEVMTEYRNNPRYQKDGKPDVLKLKKEAAARILAKIVGQAVDQEVDHTAIGKTKGLWQRFVDWLKKLFSKAAFDPFKEAAEQVTGKKEFKGTVADVKGKEEFLHQEDTFDEIYKKGKTIAKSGDKYIVNGVEAKNSVENDVNDAMQKKYHNTAEFFEKREEFRKETESKLIPEMGDISKRWLEADGTVRKEEVSQPITSIIDPYDHRYVNTLNKWFGEKVNSYPPGTKFMINKPIYASKGDIAGTANMIAFMPDGKIDLYQFKSLTTGKSNKDISPNVQAFYNQEVQGLKDILKTAYAVPESAFRETRAIPVKTIYEGDEHEGFELTGMKIGNVNVKLIKDLTVLPVPVSSETTGNKDLDILINKFRANLVILANDPIKPGEEAARKKRVTELLAGIRTLQVQGKAERFLETAENLVTFHKESFAGLKKKIEDTIPEVAGISGLKELAEELDVARRELSSYIDLYDTMREVFGEDAIETKRAKVVSDSADSLMRDTNRLQDFLRSKKFAPLTPIQDTLSPEKSLDWWPKFIRSLGQSSIVSGQLLHFLLNRIPNLYVRRFGEILKHMEVMHKAIDDVFNSDFREVNKKVFEYDAKGRWTGGMVKEISPEFGKALETALIRSNHQWLQDNIDIDAYTKWYDEKLADKIETNKTARYAADDELNQKIRDMNLKEFKRIHDISKKTSANRNNHALRRFPRRDKWESNEYKEIAKIPALKEFYDWWQGMIEKGHELGMFQENQKRNGFFPNIRKDWLSLLASSGEYEGAIFDPFNSIRIKGDDEAFGEIDQQTGLPLNRIHPRYVNDLTVTTKDTDGETYRDYGWKSQDLFRAMALFAREVVLFELRTEIEPLAKLILDIEKRKPALQTTRSGLLAKGKGNQPAPTVENSVNIDYIEQHMAFALYGQHIKGSDVVVTIHPNAAYKFLNKLFGREIFPVEEGNEVKLSGLKTLQVANRMFRAIKLGGNILSGIANLFGGSTNTFIKAGRWFTIADAMRAATRLATHKFTGEEGAKYAALIDLFDPTLDDVKLAKTRKLSTSKRLQWLNSDHLFLLMRKSDEAVNHTVFLAFVDNTVLRNGQLLNVRELVKEEMKWDKRLDLPEAEREQRERDVEAKIEDMKANSPEMLMRRISLTKEGNIVWPEHISDEQFILYRTRSNEFTRAILGNTSTMDVSLFNRSMIMVSFMMFKSWIPRMLDERLRPLGYAPGVDDWEWGRLRMLVNAVTGYGLDSVNAILKSLVGKNQSLITIARKEYQKKKQYFADQNIPFTMTEADFVDNYVKGVRSSFKELGLALAMMGILLAVRAWYNDNKDESHQTRGMFKFTLRAIDKLQDEISFFYNPSSFTSILNGSIFPAVGLAVDAQKILSNSAAYGWDWLNGDQQGMDKQHIAKYIYKDVPILKELTNYFAVWSEKFAKDNGIIIQSQSGGH